jgi:predicted dehydrogenase
MRTVVPRLSARDAETPPALSVLIVGAGPMGRWHADAAVCARGRVEAVIDRDFARAQSLAARYPGAIATRQFSPALAARTTSVVHLCTPLATHESLGGEALEAGCHVLAEKPLAPTLEATRRLLELAARRRVLLCPVHQFLFQSGTLRILQVLPRLGDLRHVDLTICSAGADGQSDAVRDQLAFDILPHPLSLLALVLGPRFADVKWDARRAAAGELRLSGVTAGASVGVVVSMSGRPTVNVLRVVAEHGSASCDFFHGFATIESGAVSRARKILRPLAASSETFLTAVGNLGSRIVRREYAYPGLRELVRRFYQAVIDEGASPISPADTLAVAAVRDDVIASCRPDTSPRHRRREGEPWAV